MKKRVTVKAPRLIVLIVALLFMAIIAKLSYVVLSEKVDGINLQEKSASITTVERKLYANRGSILDVNGEVFAESVNSYTLIAYLSESRTTDPNNPKHVVDKETTAEKLSEVIDMDKDRILKILNKKAYQVEFGTSGKDLTEGKKAEIEKLELPGIDFIATGKKRYYNNSSFASYIIGYTKKDDGIITGELGIEGYYDDILSGSNGYRKYLKYSSGNYQIPNTPEEIVEAEDGSDIYLTIDKKIQMLAENTVTKIKENFNTNWAIFTLMDAKTGAIVASATNPNYDPNKIGTIVESGYLNPLVSYQYEPGSVMKIFSWASTIEEGKYNGSDTYKSGSYVLKDGTEIRDANRKGWGTITFDKGFAFSSNVAATHLALKLGASTLNDYYTKLGFGEKTGIELYNEVVGKIDFKRESELSNAAFGQGISVTPIQMLQALSSMTNDGTVIKPYIVDKIVDSNGNVTYEGGRKVVSKVYSSSTVAKMHELMHDMIYTKENAKYWQIDGVTVMGKTGTAQIASPNGGYLHGTYDYVKSFAGIFPEENPKYILYVAARKPETGLSAWAKVITSAIEEIATYAKLTSKESDVDPNKLIDIDNYISTSVESTKNSLINKKIDTVVLGDGKYVINQYPTKNSTLLADNKLFLVTNSKNYTMLDLTGWSLSDVTSFCNLIGLKLEYSGHGYVTSQSIAKDSVIDINNSVLTVELDKEKAS